MFVFRFQDLKIETVKSIHELISLHQIHSTDKLLLRPNEQLLIVSEYEIQHLSNKYSLKKLFVV